jgi:ferrochelatase
MVRELVAERTEPGGERLRRRLGELPLWDTCPTVCCVPPRRP